MDGIALLDDKGVSGLGMGVWRRLVLWHNCR